MKKGFTLIELLVVIAIIAILAAILFPVFAKAREKARQTTCTSNQKQIATAVMMYTQENDESLPVVDSNVFSTLGITGKVLNCPNTKGQGYIYNAVLSDLGLGQIDAPTQVWLTADAKDGAAGPVGYSEIDMSNRHNKGVIASFVDTHVVFSKKTEDVVNRIDETANGFWTEANESTWTAPTFTPTATSRGLALNTTSEAVKITTSGDKPAATDKLLPGRAYGIVIKDFAIPTLAAGEKVTVKTEFYVWRQYITGADMVSVGKAITEEFTSTRAAADYYVRPMYIAQSWEELKELGTYQSQNKVVLMPLVTFTVSGTGTTTKVQADKIGIVCYGK